ncbi:hypothetical protein ACFFSH_14255 [Streptomyces filamentosus]|uniref:Uncharacterized protein n=1 Tax=Streptomyces filamentosus TaxID=67294 RepID=A0A919BS42_STRFL|nr:hypothetical protein [Streptomyces filamentosus]GHG08870.1 hypothetical protein GCM10017667_46240 [Streptomyces filamentosus]
MDDGYAYRPVYVDVAAPETAADRLRWVPGVEAVAGEPHELRLGPLLVDASYDDCVTGERAHPHDFLQWPTVLECEAVPGAAPAEVTGAVAGLLRTPWDIGFKALAACDFEDELPENGGSARYPSPTAR